MPDRKKNLDKYCDYHLDNGHNTNKCFHMKKLIEKMIKAGEKTQFIKVLRDKLGPRGDREQGIEEVERY